MQAAPQLPFLHHFRQRTSGIGHRVGERRCCQDRWCDTLGKRGGEPSHLHKHMSSLADLSLWLLTTLVQAFVVYLFLIQGLFRKFLFLNCYLLLSVTISLGRYFVFSHFGLASSAYAYFYYFTDAALTLFLYLGICELGVRLVGTRLPRKKVVLWSAAALLATAWFSFSVALPWGSRTAMVFELSQNIFFTCCLGVALLWAWKLRNDSNDRIADRLVNVLSAYFLLFLLLYGARQLTPHVSSLNALYPMFSAWLPLGCGFALVSHERHQE